MRPCHLYWGHQRRRNANLPGDMLDDDGGGGDFAGIARKAAQELKELKQDRETESAHSGRIVQTALLVRLQSPVENQLLLGPIALQ